MSSSVSVAETTKSPTKLGNATMSTFHQAKGKRVTAWKNYLRKDNTNPDCVALKMDLEKGGKQYIVVRLDYVTNQDEALQAQEVGGRMVIKARDTHFYGVISEIQ